MTLYITDLPQKEILYLDKIISEYYNMETITRSINRINFTLYDYIYISVGKNCTEGLYYSDMNYLKHIKKQNHKTINYIDWLKKNNLFYKLESAKLGLL